MAAINQHCLAAAEDLQHIHCMYIIRLFQQISAEKQYLYINISWASQLPFTVYDYHSADSTL